MKKILINKNKYLIILIIFNLFFLNFSLANDQIYENEIDFGYSEWVCLNADLVLFSSKNKSKLEELIINSQGEISKKTMEFKAANSEVLYPFNLHHYFFKNHNEVVWVEVKNIDAENNMVVSTLIVEEGFPISRDLYLGDSAKKFGKKINKKIINLNGNYKLSCDLVSLDVFLKNGKIVAAKWHSMID